MAKYNRDEFIGKRYGRLTVQESFRKIREDGSSGFYWRCKCDCGKVVVKRPIELVSGKIVSCGCNKAEKASKRMKKHGMSSTRLYHTWRDMKDRCYNPNKDRYVDWGGRGIKVCDEWLEFEPFMRWAIENGYKDGLTLERKDVNGNYEPSNCTWIPQKDQALNRRNTRFIEHNGEIHCISEWGRILGITNESVLARLYRGMSIEEALSKPFRGKKQ